MEMEFDKLAVVQAGHLLGLDQDRHGNPNYVFCQRHATLVGNGVCAGDYFMIPIYPEEARFNQLVADMRQAGCSREFLEYAREAQRSGAHYILYYV